MASQDSFCSGTTCTIPDHLRPVAERKPPPRHLVGVLAAKRRQTGQCAGQKIKVGGHTVSGIMQTAFTLDVGYRTGVKLRAKLRSPRARRRSPSRTAALPSNVPLFFAANTADCPPDSWPDNCRFKAFYTSAAITNATTATLRNAYRRHRQLFDRRLEPCTNGMPVGDDAEASTWWSMQNASVSIAASATETPSCRGGTRATPRWRSSTMATALSLAKRRWHGPWVGADLENGMFEGWENGSGRCRATPPSPAWTIVTAMVKGPRPVAAPRA
jgi:hypothetical protein